MATFHTFTEFVLAPCYLFDSSYLVSLLIATEPLHDESVAFFERLAEQQDAERRYLISPLAYAEVANASARIFLQADLGLNPPEAQRKLRDEGPGPVSTKVLAVLDLLAEALDRLGDGVFQVRLDVDLWTRAAALLAAHSLQPYDAIHLASALHARCDHIVTFDKGFERVPNISIWRAF